MGHLTSTRACSNRCKQLLVFSYQQSPDEVVKHAHCLANDRNQSAVRFAKMLSGDPEEFLKKFSLISGAAKYSQESSLLDKIKKCLEIKK